MWLDTWLKWWSACLASAKLCQKKKKKKASITCHTVVSKGRLETFKIILKLKSCKK
jgi:hypothetical protein